MVVPPTPVVRCDPSPALVALRRDAVSHDSPPPRVVFTWTTAEQLEALKAGERFLSREESPTRGPSIFDLVVQRLAGAGDPAAGLLREPRFRRARFAWSAAWPTLRGWEGETYGDRLLRVVLRPEALVLRLHARRGFLGAAELSGRAVPITEVTAHPERLAAVLFVQDFGPGYGSMLGSAAETALYREVVLVNEAMLESWESGTDAIDRELDRSVDLVTAFRGYLASGCVRSLPTVSALAAWGLAGDEEDPVRAWYRALSIAGSRYDPSVPVLDALLAALGRVPRGSPRVTPLPTAAALAAPAVTAPAPAPARRPPPSRPPQRRQGGTF